MFMRLPRTPLHGVRQGKVQQCPEASCPFCNPRSCVLSFLVRTLSVQIIRNHFLSPKTHGFIAQVRHGGGRERAKASNRRDFAGC